MKTFDCLIVGAGHGGAQAALALRQQKFTGSIGLLGDERELPYERPALSKEYLAGTKNFDRMLLRNETGWQSRDVTLLPGTRIVSVEPDMHRVTAASGEQFGYRHMIWATGGRPRRLTCPGHDLAGVHYVRTRDDIDGLLADLPQAQRIVVIGGGYIGLEAAAVLRKLGKAITVVEMADRVLVRVAAEPLSRFLEAEHRSHGVEIRLSTTVAGLTGNAGRVRGVELGDGIVLPADLIIVGIGILPAVDPLVAAGGARAEGVEVDEFCRTILPDIFAIGDCALHNNIFANGTAVRLESVQNANDQAIVVAKYVSGLPVSYSSVPWFWSNQYDIRLQTVGLARDYDQVVVRGDPAERKFTLAYLRQGQIQAFDCVNSTKDYVEGRALVINRSTPCMAKLADPSITLKSFGPTAASA